jgi:hypothetical protein
LTSQVKKQGRTQRGRHHKAYLHSKLSILALCTRRIVQQQRETHKKLKLKLKPPRETSHLWLRYPLFNNHTAASQTQDENRMRTQALNRKTPRDPIFYSEKAPRLPRPDKCGKNLTTAAHMEPTARTYLLPGSDQYAGTKFNAPNPGRRRKTDRVS